MSSYHLDLIIFGGGIAGLWTYNVLKDAGYSVVLLEKDKLGGTQSMASQGMIHGGQRYALQGKANSHSESISEMPKVWQDCLEGKASPDLSSAKILSEQQYLWSPGGLTSNVTSFFASKAMNSRVDALDPSDWPDIFKAAKEATGKKFKGKIYQLDEVCLDIKSVTEALRSRYPESIYHAPNISYNTQDGRLQNITINSEKENITVSADRYIFTAGSGNESITESLAPEKKLTQRRPLRQVLVKDLDFPLYAHCITIDPRPRMTVSAHPLANGKYTWYLGGLVAVKNIDTGDEEAIKFAKSELSTLFPWIDWQNKEWSTVYVDRAEPYTSTGFLPEGSAVKSLENCLIAWPTKLTFAPQLANNIKHELDKQEIKPARQDTQEPLLPLSNPETAKYPWENTTWR